MGLTVTTSLHPEAWDQFISQNTHSNIFHTRQFVDCFSDSEHCIPHTYFLLDTDRPVAMLSAIKTRILGSHLESLSSRLVVYGGILHDSQLSNQYLLKHIAELMRAYDDDMGKKAIFTEIRNINDAAPLILPLSQEHYRFAPHLNYLIDLSEGKDAVFQSISSTLRRKINRAFDKGIEVHEIANQQEFATFYSMILNTYRQVHVPVFGREILLKAWNNLSESGWIRITLAKYNGEFCGGRAALVFNDRVFDWYAGSNEKGYDLNVNALLTWEMMEWGANRGLKLFDFGGAGDPNQKYGVRDYKSRFHGQVVNYGRFIKIYSRMRYAVANAAYGLLRRVMF